MSTRTAKIFFDYPDTNRKPVKTRTRTVVMDVSAENIERRVRSAKILQQTHTMLEIKLTTGRVKNTLMGFGTLGNRDL